MSWVNGSTEAEQKSGSMADTSKMLVTDYDLDIVTKRIEPTSHCIQLLKS